MKKSNLILTILLIAVTMIIAGCAWQSAPPSVEVAPVEVEPEEPEEVEVTEPAEPEVTEPEEVAVEPVHEPVRYTEPDPEPSSVEADTCGCSFRWDPLCGNDGKTYLNQCLFKCKGFSEDDIDKNSQCPKKKSPIKIYADDAEFDYETDEWNGGFCWRQMYRDSGIRYCKNMIVNGRVNEDPEPLRGNWLDEDHLVDDFRGRAHTSTIKLATGEQARNEEYDMAFQPFFETGKYRLSFYARQDVSAFNDWTVEFEVKDWWDSKPRPVGVTGCYRMFTVIDAQDVYIDVGPNKWRHYHYDFDVPLDTTQWTGFERAASDCEYEWNNVPGGYGLTLTGPTVGDAWFDDFHLEKIE